jgi:hypothetical protein
MGLGATVGADLLSVPFPKMVFDLARAIAKGQTALDRASLGTLRVLANTEFDYIPEITEVIAPGPVDTAGGVSTQSEFEFGVEATASAGFLFASGSVSSHVDYRTSNTYSYSAEGSSLLRTTLKPVPPPARMMPRFITVNTLVQPPQITTSE